MKTVKNVTKFPNGIEIDGVAVYGHHNHYPEFIYNINFKEVLDQYGDDVAYMRYFGVDIENDIAYILV